MWSPELETLDQLLGSDLPLVVLRKIFSNDARFVTGVHGLLVGGDAQLIADDETEIPQWQWRSLFLEGNVFNDIGRLKLRITDQGVTRIG